MCVQPVTPKVSKLQNLQQNNIDEYKILGKRRRKSSIDIGNEMKCVKNKKKNSESMVKQEILCRIIMNAVPMF